MNQISSPDQLLDNILIKGICADIHFVLMNKRIHAAILLTYAGMDAMATLDRPAGVDKVSRMDFVRWTDTYIQFKDGTISGLELYSARCAMLHNYGSESDLTRTGEARQIGYTAGGGPDVMTKEDVPGLVLVSVEGLIDAFFQGIQKYMKSLLANPNRRMLVAQRLPKMLNEFQLKDLK